LSASASARAAPRPSRPATSARSSAVAAPARLEPSARVAESNGIHFPWDIKGGILGDAATALSYGDLSAIPAPVDQWAAVPTAGKLQILGTIAVLEFVGETMEPHYMRGGKPGFYPSLKDAAGGGKGNIPHPVPLDLYDPFGFFEGDSEEKKARGRNVEINNGSTSTAASGSFSEVSWSLLGACP